MPCMFCWKAGWTMHAVSNLQSCILLWLYEGLFQSPNWRRNDEQFDLSKWWLWFLRTSNSGMYALITKKSERCIAATKTSIYFNLTVFVYYLRLINLQIRKLVTEDQFELYEKQLLSTTLETMPDVALCPRINCQCPTLIIRERNMGHCPKCEYAFCIYCRGGYHGLDSCR